MCKISCGLCYNAFFYGWVSVAIFMEVFMSSPSPCPEVLAFLHGCLGALLDDCNKVGDHAAYGRYIHDLDDFLYIEGRKFMREVSMILRCVMEILLEMSIKDWTHP